LYRGTEATKLLSNLPLESYLEIIAVSQNKSISPLDVFQETADLECLMLFFEAGKLPAKQAPDQVASMGPQV
jgi:hypothetical protein